MRSRPARSTRPSNLGNTPTSYAAPAPSYQAPVPMPIIPMVPAQAPNPPRPPVPTRPQALQSTYASRLKTGVTLLVQPIFASATASNLRTAARRGGVINYADPGSGDDLPDAGALDSDDSDFIASGGTRTSIRQSRSGRTVGGVNVFNSSSGVSTPRPGGATPQPLKTELDRSYLGAIPPPHFIKPKLMTPTQHVYQ